MRTLTDARRDLVHTIRQVVDVVSKYAGGALPEPARTRVRGFILKLPQRWASKTGVSVPSEGNSGADRERESVTAAASGSCAVRRSNRRAPYRERGTGADSKTSSRAPSPSSPRVARNTVIGAQTSGVGTGDVGSSAEPVVSAGAAVLAAQRILTLATESLDMMRGVTGVMKDSLDRADAYVSVYFLVQFSTLTAAQMGQPPTHGWNSEKRIDGGTNTGRDTSISEHEQIPAPQEE